MGKKNNRVPQRRGMNALERVRANIDEKYEIKQRFQTDFLLQAGCDAFMMTAADMFDLGPDRAMEAMNTYRDYIMKMMENLIEDSKDDDELTYYWADLDRRLKQIVGEEHFAPYEQRYDETGVRIFGELYRRTARRIAAMQVGDGTYSSDPVGMSWSTVSSQARNDVKDKENRTTDGL